MAELEFRLPAFDETRHEVARPKRRAVIMGVAATVTVTGLGAALYVGGLAYDVRRNNLHNSRLKNILGQAPTIYQVTEGLKEKAPLVLVVEDRRDLEEAMNRWGRDKVTQIRDTANEWPQLRVYEAGDMIYFVYFDDADIMRAYICVSV
jgi:hypothetical protein